MKRLASEVLNDLESRVAKLERQSSRVITSSLSRESKSMMLALANHSRKTPMSTKGNFNVLQEVLENLGFTYRFKENQTYAFKGYQFVKEAERVSNGEFTTLLPSKLSVCVYENSTVEQALKDFKNTMNQLMRLSYVDFVSQNSGKTEFGHVSFIYNEDDIVVSEDQGTVRIENYTPTNENNIYEGVKEVLISKRGRKLKLNLDGLSNLEDFDLKEILRFAVTKSTIKDAQSLMSSFDDSFEVQESTLLEKGKGTCCFCGSIQSIKRDGTLHKHGYRLYGFMQSQECYGSFLPPIETSSEGMKKVKKRLLKDISDIERRLSSDSTERRRQENNIKSLENLITQLDQKIRAWKPQA